MLVFKKSILSGEVSNMVLDVTQEQLDQYAAGNGLIQEVFPNLNYDEREFLMTGITPSEWETTFSEDDE
jgi:hypothetical protein